MKTSKNVFLKLLFWFLIFFCWEKGIAQGDIDLSVKFNISSFEEYARPTGHVPRGRYDGGRLKFPEETPPNVHPESEHTMPKKKLSVSLIFQI